jgi:dihydrodiol dehydrogenase / D-xylose 1-dehydrogenase (NADP)
MANTSPIRWGIMAPGRITRKFARDLALLDDAEIVAVASRSQKRADQFGDEFSVPRRYGSYEQLVQDPDVDAVYVAAPHNLHAERSVLCLEHGKAVLCEKPFTANARQAREIVQAARTHRVFCMEAMWMRFLPAAVKLRELLAAGTIGTVRMVEGMHGFRGPYLPEERLLNPALAGGALLDMGIYPVSLAFMVLGRPSRISGMAHIGKTGVDEQSTVLFGYGGGEIAICTSAIQTSLPTRASITGTEGIIDVGDPAVPYKLVVTQGRGQPQVYEPPHIGLGYAHEALEVHRCLREGRLESDVMPLDESVTIMETLDQIRAQWGMRYPFD